MIRVAINGFGRIGRSVLRALNERTESELEIVAVNEPADAEAISHLTRYDSTHGRFPGKVRLEQQQLVIDDKPIALSHHDNLDAVDWQRHNIDLVLECSGVYRQRQQIAKHLTAGARRVLISYPVKTGEADNTVVLGVNQNQVSENDRIVSSASCTTNCVAPVLDVLDRAFGVESAVIRTLHSAMNDQHVLDSYHPTDLRKARSAFSSFVPVETELARGVERILPGLSGKLEAQAMRLPVSDVSAIDLAVVVSTDVEINQINCELRSACGGHYSGVLAITDERLASCDFVHDPHSGTVDASQTIVAGRLVKLLIWFDNEWGYANRMIDVAEFWTNPARGYICTQTSDQTVQRDRQNGRESEPLD